MEIAGLWAEKMDWLDWDWLVLVLALALALGGLCGGGRTGKSGTLDRRHMAGGEPAALPIGQAAACWRVSEAGTRDWGR